MSRTKLHPHEVERLFAVLSKFRWDGPAGGVLTASKAGKQDGQDYLQFTIEVRVDRRCLLKLPAVVQGQLAEPVALLGLHETERARKPRRRA